MRVYRFEDPSGSGCFECGALYDYDAAAIDAGIHPDPDLIFHSTELGFPPPWNDASLTEDALTKGYTTADLNCGFATRDQAREWFPPELTAALERHGQTLTVWEVDEEDAASGDRQVMFHKPSATLLERLPPSALYQPERQAELPLAA